MTGIVDLVQSGLALADRDKVWLGPTNDNANLISTATLYKWANEGAGELYGILCGTYEDYNVKPALFSLAGGSNANNQPSRTSFSRGRSNSKSSTALLRS
jgi:hypothetical protein